MKGQQGFIRPLQSQSWNMVTLYIHSGMQLLTQNQKAIVLVLDMSIQSLATPLLANISLHYYGK
jgi:hypothetical protein